MNEYVAFEGDSGTLYIKEDRIEDLKKIGAAIFDCDGVLLDVRGSYNRAISTSFAFIFQSLTGSSIPADLITDEIIYCFRRTGGFNNDWDTVYGIIMFFLCNLPSTIKSSLKECLSNIELKKDPYERLSLAASMMKGRGRLDMSFFKKMLREIKDFTDLLDYTGVRAVDAALQKITDSSEDLDFITLVKTFLNHPSGVREGIISRVFEEFFCGGELFRETYGAEPKFNKGHGMINNEKSIIEMKTLNWLETTFGKENLGIASGSRLKPAKYALGSILEKFNPKATIFLDDIEMMEDKIRVGADFKVDLKKPNPFPLLKASEAFGSNVIVLYVGDSMEDALMVRRANEVSNRFYFAGVYKYSGVERAALNSFLETKCEIVMPSVNELPVVYQILSEGKS
ncbi:MAG: hypothetical protein RMJ07_02245 [Nitrososphaerota archaeon]|nr:hypothetical protein [Candidatus Bathyarchaeota archaeon]MDW8048490.1 hypothetical protein [Nitrososphaerota archaeon]